MFLSIAVYAVLVRKIRRYPSSFVTLQSAPPTTRRSNGFGGASLSPLERPVVVLFATWSLFDPLVPSFRVEADSLHLRSATLS